MVNGDSANPLLIYLVVDRAVKSGDVNHPKIRQWRDGLKRGVEYRYKMGQFNPKLTRQEIDRLKLDIESAEISWLKPQIWKLDITNINIDNLRPPRNEHPFPDEYRDGDFRGNRITIIVE